MLGYRMLVYITEKEMMALDKETMPEANGHPVYYTVVADGVVKIWPGFDPKKYSLMCKVEKVG